MFVSPMAVPALYSCFLWLPTAIIKGKEFFQVIIDANQSPNVFGQTEKK